jgi:hypothetical protein
MIRRQNRMKTSPIDAAMEMLRSKGRNGDTELAHVNPREKAILKALGGAGSKNPRTGLREYFDAGVEGGGSVGNVGDPSNPSDPGTEGGVTGSGGIPGGGIPGDISSNYLEGAGPTKETSIIDSIRSFVDQNINSPVPATPASLAAYGLAYGLGAGARALGVDGPSRSAAADFAGGMGPTGGGNRSESALGYVPVSAPTPRYLRGSQMDAPQEISSFIGPGMSDIQQRALISTYGTQGVNSAFRTDPVRRYYANLLSRGLISDAGAPVQNPYVLPIEQQYASQVLGRPMTNPSDAASAYESIRGLL